MKKNRENAFTLIELLAVIIILGILMIIAIPSVTRYINDSRKAAYVNTAKQVANAAKNLVNSGKLEMYDTTVAYYIPNACIRVENGEKAKSPYGDFIDDRTYVVVTYDGTGYDYYWVSLDDTGIGVKEPISIDKLNEDNIESDLKKDDVRDNNGVGKESVVIFNSTCDGKINKNAYSDSVCIRATRLHTSECTISSLGCYDAGYVEGNKGTTITYGNLGTKGVLKSGDAFDCDVNGDGIYDFDKERFYYITTYDGENESKTATLIYYGNVKSGVLISNDRSLPNYSSLADIKSVDENVTIEDNIHGPVTAYKHLPSTEQWSNPHLKSNQVRSITNENGSKTTHSGSIVATFSYSGKAARLLTYQEAVKACGTGLTGTAGYFDKCIYLMENTTSFNYSITALGYWLETPNSTNNKAYTVYSNFRKISDANVTSSMYAVRPVIDVELSKIDY